jgi:hypothetical protein
MPLPVALSRMWIGEGDVVGGVKGGDETMREAMWLAIRRVQPPVLRS